MILYETLVMVCSLCVFLQEISHRFGDCVEQINRVQQTVIQVELANWRQSQRLFSWEDDTGRLELNTIQHWCESLAEMLWRLRQLAKQVHTYTVWI